MVIDWDGMLLQIISYNLCVRMQLKIQTVIFKVISMTISILNMELEQLFIMAVERR